MAPLPTTAAKAPLRTVQREPILQQLEVHFGSWRKDSLFAHDCKLQYNPLQYQSGKFNIVGCSKLIKLPDHTVEA